MKKIILICFFTLFLTTNCGFKIVPHTQSGKFEIIEIISLGDKKINYRIKNKLNFNSTESEKKLIKINLETKKQKLVKEKNIKNEITKYEVNISVKIKYEIIGIDDSTEFSIYKSGEYEATSQYSKTLDNEKKLIKLLTDDISEQILDELSVRLNGL
jgi:hypothetical protein